MKNRYIFWTNFQFWKSITMKFNTLFLVYFTLSFNCSSPNPPKKMLIPQMPSLAMGIAYDISGSVKKWPELDTLSLRRLGEIVGYRGGIIAIGTISENSFVKLNSYTLKLDTVVVEGKLTERAAKRKYNMKLANKFKKEINNYVLEVNAKISIKRDRPETDINGCLKRFQLFFNEPIYNGWEKVLIVFSDGKDTVKKEVDHLPDADFITVGMPQETANKIFGPNVIKFESLSGLIKYLTSNFL